MTFFGHYGKFKVWSCYVGGLSEFQVRQGNRVLSRHIRLIPAMDDAKARHLGLREEAEETAALHTDISEGSFQ